MIYLSTNTSGQDLYLTLKEGREFVDTFTHYLIVLTLEVHDNTTTGNTLAQVATIDYENDRITKVTVTTVGLTLPGRYRYEVYGQNSNSNTDPENASVVGLIEKGWGVLTDNTQYFTEPDMTATNFIVNGE
jgi:hypothetical protein